MFSKDIVIKTENLHKYYKKLHALDSLSINVCRGDVYGFLGPNGSGKTTTIKLMLGLIRPYTGKVLLQGYDVLNQPVKALNRVGSVVETPKFYTYLSAYENCMLSGKLIPHFQNREIMPILELVDLHKKAKKPVSTFSLGMKQRLGLAMALLHDPEVLILDEPTIALDPQGMKEIRDMILCLNQEKACTFFLSTHLLYEVEQICNRVGILNKGKLIYEGLVHEINPAEEIIEIYIQEKDSAISLLSTMPNISKIENTQDYIRLLISKGTSAEINQQLLNHGFSVSYLIPKNPSLEDFFLELTGGDDIHA